MFEKPLPDVANRKEREWIKCQEILSRLVCTQRKSI